MQSILLVLIVTKLTLVVLSWQSASHSSIDASAAANSVGQGFGVGRGRGSSTAHSILLREDTSGRAEDDPVAAPSEKLGNSKVGCTPAPPPHLCPRNSLSQTFSNPSLLSTPPPKPFNHPPTTPDQIFHETISIWPYTCWTPIKGVSEPQVSEPTASSEIDTT